MTFLNVWYLRFDGKFCNNRYTNLHYMLHNSYLKLSSQHHPTYVMHILVFKFCGRCGRWSYCVSGLIDIAPLGPRLISLMRDPIFFANPQVFEQLESDDKLEPKNAFLFLVDTGAGNSLYCSRGLIHASETAFLKSWCNNKFFNSILKIDVQVYHICVINHNTDRPK